MCLTGKYALSLSVSNGAQAAREHMARARRKFLFSIFHVSFLRCCGSSACTDTLYTPLRLETKGVTRYTFTSVLSISVLRLFLTYIYLSSAVSNLNFIRGKYTAFPVAGKSCDFNEAFYVCLSV